MKKLWMSSICVHAPAATAAPVLAAFALSTLVLSACATNPAAPKEDKTSAERSKIYIQSVGVVAASSREARGGVCAVPTGLRGVNTGSGESKVWKDLVSRADTCVNESNWTVLENLANEMSKADLDSPWPAYFLGLAADAHGDFSRAMWMTDLAQKKSGGKIALFTYQRGRVWMHMHETGKAIAELQKSVAMEPNLLDGQMYLAEIYNRDQDFDRASGYYRAALKVDDKNYVALMSLAEIVLAKNGTQEATDLFNRATVAGPNQVQPWLRLAYIYENIQKNPELTLTAYRVLKSKIDSGSIHEKMDFDVNARIKLLEDGIRARQPATQPVGKQVAKAGTKDTTSVKDPKASAKNESKPESKPVSKSSAKAETQTGHKPEVNSGPSPEVNSGAASGAASGAKTDNKGDVK